MLTRRIHDADSIDHADTADDADAGFSLIELLVTMTLTLIVGSIATAMLVATSGQAASTGSQSLTVSRARIALNSIISLLQSADTPTGNPGAAANRFDTMTATQLVFYSDVNNRSAQNTRTAPVKVSLQLSSTQVIESLYQPTSTTAGGTSNYPSNPTSTVTLLGGDTATMAAGSTFTYCTGAAPTDSTGACTAATTATQVASVGITLVMAGPSGATSSTQTFSASVAVPGVVTS